MKFKNRLLPFAIATSLVLGLTSCSDDDSPDNNGDGGGDIETQDTIGAFVEGAANYSSLSAALDATGLKETLNSDAQFTVFAPDNDAFATFLTAAGFENGLADVDTDEEIAIVRNILLNHVIGAELKAVDVLAATESAPFYGNTLAEGPVDLSGAVTNLSIVVNSDLMINGLTEITIPDAYDASNGVIHAVNSVVAEPLISTFAIADERLSTLAGALVDQGLVATVDNINPATVLAPINTAFDGVTIDTDELTNILTYHVIGAANAVASDVIGLTETPATVLGQTIVVGDGPTFTGNANTTAANVVIANIQAVNGVIHVIDTILLPSSSMTSAAN